MNDQMTFKSVAQELDADHLFVWALFEVLTVKGVISLQQVLDQRDKFRKMEEEMGVPLRFWGRENEQGEWPPIRTCEAADPSVAEL
jgi:hypothetical protein